MNKDWFPFFSMLFWCVTKTVGLVSLWNGLQWLGPTLAFGSGWWLTFMQFVVPVAFGIFLLITDVVYDMAVGAMQSRIKSGV